MAKSATPPREQLLYLPLHVRWSSFLHPLPQNLSLCVYVPAHTSLLTTVSFTHSIPVEASLQTCLIGVEQQSKRTTVKQGPQQAGYSLSSLPPLQNLPPAHLCAYTPE